MFILISLGILIAAAVNPVLGKPKIEGRISNGFETTIEEFPYQAQMLRSGGAVHHCGATIVGRQGDTYTHYVITAAQCIGSFPRPFYINAGVTNRTQTGQLSEVSGVYPYPPFNMITLQGDIAVLKLQKPIYFNDQVKPVYLPEANEVVPENTIAFTSGWGLTETGEESINLHAAQVNVLSKEKCSKTFGKTIFTELNLCAGDINKPKDICDGDTGGPLVSNGKLIGISSWGYGCGNAEYPSVYTNVSQFREWLDTIIKA